ncbi:hypothetical protein LTR37_010749 [Vermiconidia calcicola]|uniref:Uncharacterized protein n=1 Tax=Vermiconidia calcicola TaxID=1690605 RepID=A0ACC3N5S4_9PEZI|nr:hypothetical protein LTR37_010749 [Vermiconidia calcicola]
MAELQTIPARHGTATFVPAGQTIKIVNTSGTQVIDTWAFALPNPDTKKGSQEQKQEQKPEQDDTEAKKDTKSAPAQKKKNGGGLPSQEEAEKATEEGMKGGEEATQGGKPQQTPKKWSSYVPSIGWSKKNGAKEPAQETEQQKNSRTWSSIIPTGQGFGNYIPQSASDTVSAFASTHQVDHNKSYIQQLTEFSKTPVGAAGWSGLAALTGSGYSGSLYSGYQAWNAQHPDQPAMEFMSMPHTRSGTLHLRPRVDDTLLSNLREPILTLVEDTSPGIHDTLIAACDPARYKGLGVEEWMEHGSCAENLVLALKELNERAGLKGNKGVGADVTINSVPAPLNLFMNIPWDEEGDIGFHAPKCKKGDYVRLKAERDVVVVMSACPQDVLDINNKQPTDAHFIVEGDEEPKQAIKRTQPKKRPPPRKISSSHATSTVGADSVKDAPVKKPVPQKRAVPAKKPTGTTPAQKQSTQAAQPAKKKPAPAPVKSQKTSEAPETNNSADTATKEPEPAPAQPQKTSEAPAATNSTDTAAPVQKERKKPKKLAPRAKPAA